MLTKCVELEHTTWLSEEMIKAFPISHYLSNVNLVCFFLTLDISAWFVIMGSVEEKYAILSMHPLLTSGKGIHT